MNKKQLRQFVKSQFTTFDFNQICVTGRTKIQINIPFNLKDFDYRKLTKARQIKGIAKVYSRRRKNEFVLLFIFSEKFFNEGWEV